MSTNGWFVKNLGDPMLAVELLAQIANLFAAIYGEVSQQPEIAVFSRHESHGDLHCQLLVYFAPATEKLATKLAAQTCRKPTPQELSLLFGSDRSLNVLFETLNEDASS